MLNLQLLFPKSQPAAAALAAASFPTSLNVQPAAGSAAPTAPSDPFARTSQPGADLEAVRAGIRNIVETTAVDLSVAHSIALGNAVILPIQGTAFMIDKGVDVGAALLHIQDQTNTPVNSINVFPGDSYTLPFTFVVIENAAQAGKVLRIHYGTGIQFLPSLAGTLTISGNVAITQTLAGAPQGDDLDVANDHSFEAAAFAGPTAAQFSFVGVSNANGSGKRVYVDAFTWTQLAAGVTQLWLAFDAVALGAGQAFKNRRSGGANATATFRSGTQAGVIGGLGVPFFSVYGGIPVVPGTYRVQFPRPYIVEPNNGFYIQTQPVNQQMCGGLEIREY